MGYSIARLFISWKIPISHGSFWGYHNFRKPLFPLFGGIAEKLSVNSESIWVWRIQLQPSSFGIRLHTWHLRETSNPMDPNGGCSGKSSWITMENGGFLKVTGVFQWEILKRSYLFELHDVSIRIRPIRPWPDLHREVVYPIFTNLSTATCWSLKNLLVQSSFMLCFKPTCPMYKAVTAS